METRFTTKNFLALMIVALLFGCKKDKEVKEDESIPGTKTIHGVVQKGPYKNGTPITVYELNGSFGQTGKSFSSTIQDDIGNFSLNNINLTSDNVLLTASGYYFNEHFNKISEGALYLEALADVSTSSTVNINILTHIIKPRIEQLISVGSNFSTAKGQAQSEFLTVVGVNSGVGASFESLDLSSDFLFAMSLLFQRNNSFGYQGGYNYTAELSSLLSNFRSDFANNGIIDNSHLIDTLLYNAKRIDLIDCKIDLQNYCTGLGVSFTPVNFEQYIYNFQKKYSPVLSNSITFPDSAYILIDGPNGTPYQYRENVLKPGKKYLAPYFSQYVISAIVPYDSSLVIKFNPFNANFPFSIDGASYFGWKNNQSNPVVLEAQRKNIPLSLFIYGHATDSVKIQYFKTSSSVIPFYEKVIVFP